MCHFSVDVLEELNRDLKVLTWVLGTRYAASNGYTNWHEETSIVGINFIFLDLEEKIKI